MDLIPLAPTADLANIASKEFTLTQLHPPMEIFIIHRQGDFFAYLNRCPHTGISLNWQPHQFFDITQEYIQCATHDALFEVDSGFCVRGPCAGAYLQAIPLLVKNGTLYYDATVAQK